MRSHSLDRPKFACQAALNSMWHAGAALIASSDSASSAVTAPFERLWSEVERSSPAVGRHPYLVLSAASLAGLAGSAYYSRLLVDAAISPSYALSL